MVYLAVHHKWVPKTPLSECIKFYRCAKAEFKILEQALASVFNLSNTDCIAWRKQSSQFLARNFCYSSSFFFKSKSTRDVRRDEILALIKLHAYQVHAIWRSNVDCSLCTSAQLSKIWWILPIAGPLRTSLKLYDKVRTKLSVTFSIFSLWYIYSS